MEISRVLFVFLFPVCLILLSVYLYLVQFKLCYFVDINIAEGGAFSFFGLYNAVFVGIRWLCGIFPFPRLYSQKKSCWVGE